MPFIDIPMLESHTNILLLHDRRPGFKTKREHTILVTDVARHIRDGDLHSLICRYIRIEKSALTSARQLISPPTKVTTNPLQDFWEHVSDLTGVAITAAFEWKRTTVGDVLKNKRDRAVWFAEQAARHEAKNSGYKFRWLQLRKQQRNRFGWMIGFLDRAVKRIEGEVTQEGKIAMKDLQPECELASSIAVPLRNRDKPEPMLVKGRADVVFDPRDGSRATIWEIKLVRSLKLEHVAQIVQYGLLWANKHPDTPFPCLILFNVLDGERWEISTTKEEALEFVVGVFHAKRTNIQLTDDEFRQQCEKTSDEAQAIVDRMEWPIDA
jgi:hypothetical protein